mgnify:CR=1 FL=1
MLIYSHHLNNSTKERNSMKEYHRIFGYHVHTYKALESELINGTEYVFSVQSPYTGKFILVFRFNVAMRNNKD